MPYTSRQLIDAAYDAGYDLTEQEFKDFGRKGRELFPPPRRFEGTHGIWEDADFLRLLDLLWLRKRRNNAESMRLGLWLHGHDVDRVNEMLVRQVDAMLVELIGTSELPPSSDAPFEYLSDVLDGFMRFSELAYGAGLVAPEDVVKHAIERRLPEAALRRIAFPITTARVHEYPRSDIPDDTREYILRDLVSQMMLVKTGLEPSLTLWSLPAARTALVAAPLEALDAGRNSAMYELMHLLSDFDEKRSYPHIAYKGINSAKLWEEHDRNGLHLFASPELLPLTTLLIGNSIRVMGQSIVRHLHLLALAVERLSKTRGSRPKKREALLTLLFGFEDLPEGVT